jgi:hypothetical protein
VFNGCFDQTSVPVVEGLESTKDNATFHVEAHLK